MANLAYIGLILTGMVLGALLGIAGHFWRAHATMYPEDLGLGEPLNTLTREDYQWEKHVVGAEWDDAGYWDPGSVRNLIYYLLTGMSVPLFAGAIFWGERYQIVAAMCQGLTHLGLQPPLCF